MNESQNVSQSDPVFHLRVVSGLVMPYVDMGLIV